MANNKPFEKHIESNEFNINPLVDAGTHVPQHVLQPRLEEWLESLSFPMTNGQWDNDLDDLQKRLRHCLATEIVERGILDEFAEQLQDIDQETLILLMQYPITLAMLSQDHFRQNGYPLGWETPDSSNEQSANNVNTPLHRQLLTWGKLQFNRLSGWIQNTLDKRKAPF